MRQLHRLHRLSWLPWLPQLPWLPRLSPVIAVVRCQAFPGAELDPPVQLRRFVSTSPISISLRGSIPAVVSAPGAGYWGNGVLGA
jgi:hypothetical protein